MSIDIDINTFPCDKLIETLEFFKSHDIECNILNARSLIEDERSNELNYLLDEKCLTIDDMVSAYDFDDEPKEVIFLTKIKLARTADSGKVLIDIIEHDNLDYLRCMVRNFQVFHNMFDYNNGEPLITACKLDNREMVKFIIDSGADVSQCPYDPVIDALLNDDIVLTEYLLTSGSDLRNIKSKAINEIFTENCVTSINFIIDRLEQQQMEHLRNMDWLDCLRKTVKYGNIEILLKLIRNRIDIKDNYYELKLCAGHNKMMRFYLRIIRKAHEKLVKKLVES